MNARTLQVVTAKKQATEVWPQRTTTWPEFVDWLRLHSPARRKDCGNFVLGEFRDARRTKDTCESRSSVSMDADAACGDFVLDSAAELGCAAVFYTTWRHTPENPRWRLVAPLSRDVTPNEYRLIVGALMIDLGYDQFDKGSTEPERLMHKPSTQGHYEHQVIDGPPLDADRWLARAKELGIESEPDHEPFIDDSPQRDRSLGVHPYAAGAIAKELAKLDALPHPWEEGAGWDQATFNVACNLVEFANSGWSGYTLSDALADLYEHAPADDVWGRRDHRAKFASALNKVNGGGRLNPDGTAADDFDVVEDGVDAAEPNSILSKFSRMSMRDLLDPDKPPREHVVDPFIAAGTAVAFVAPAGHRKSLLALGLSLAVARGDDHFAGMPIPKARRVLYVDMENTEDDLAERLASFGVSQDDDLDRFILVSLPSMLPLDTAKGGKEFLQAVRAYGLEKGDLVVLDSYQRITEAGENDSDTTRGYYRHTGMHLKALGLTVIRTDNTGKDVKKGARGSSGKRDDVDVEYLIESVGEYIEITTGKARQRGVGEMSIRVLVEDETTAFWSGASPTKSALVECIALLDRLDVPQNAGERRASAILEDCDSEKKPTRAVLREACKARQNRAAEARRAFIDGGADDTAPEVDGAVGRGDGSAA